VADDQQYAFIDNTVERMQSGRLGAQDYPLLLAERVREPRQRLVDSLLDFSSSGRMADQDAAPPARQMGPVSGDPRELVTMQDFFKNGHGMPISRGGSEQSTSMSGDEKKVGAFDKIRGMMRKQSLALGLGLKSTKDMSKSTATGRADE
jgi:hypothetical protein